MGKSKTLEFAISAIKNLKEFRGSTSRDIINYIKKQYDDVVDEKAVGKQVHASLKRGVACGILKIENGYYTIPIETKSAGEEIAAQEIGLMEMCCKKRSNNNRNNNNKYGKQNYNRKNNKKCRKSNCKRCGKSCPCSGSSSCLSNNRRNRINKASHVAEALFSHDSEKDTNSKTIEKLFQQSFS